MYTAKDASSAEGTSSQDFTKPSSFDATLDNSVSQPERDSGNMTPLHSDQQDVQPVKTDKAGGMVVLGAFVAGSLVGIIICAPAFVVVIFGAGVAGLCLKDSKAGEFARKVGDFGGKVILAVVKKARELNDHFHIADKAKHLAKDTGSRIQKADEKRGLTKTLKSRAASLWSHIDERTKSRRALEEQRLPEESVVVTDGTQLPFRQQTQQTDL